jgi:hypothetical protein
MQTKKLSRSAKAKGRKANLIGFDVRFTPNADIARITRSPPQRGRYVDLVTRRGWTPLRLTQPSPVSVATQASDNVIDWAQAIRTMAADSDYQKIAEHALDMLKVVYCREGPDAAVRSAKHIVEAAVAVISHELGSVETQRFLHVVGVAQGQESVH